MPLLLTILLGILCLALLLFLHHWKPAFVLVPSVDGAIQLPFFSRKHMTTANINQTVIYTVAATDKAGNTAALSTPVTWASSNPDVATISEGGTVALTGKLGSTTISATVGNLTASDSLSVVAGEAATLTITATVQ